MGILDKIKEPKFDPYSDCAFCKHFNEIETTCVAYPTVIPEELYGNWSKHRNIREDQEGEWVFEIAQWAIDKGISPNKPTKKRKK